MEPPPKQYFNSTRLEEVVLSYPIRPRDMGSKEREAEMAGRHAFLDFIRGLLNMNPIERWSPLQAAQHPFITGKVFTVPFVPPIASAPIPVTRIKVGRPRANTLSSLSLQDVPAPIQRVAAANRDKNATGVGPTERRDSIPEVGDVDLTAGSQVPLPFDMSTGVASNSTPSVYEASPPNKGTSGPSSRMNVYVSQRRESQPAIQVASRYARTSYAPSTVVPSSVPNAVWYGPDPTFGTSPDGKLQSPRRGSLKAEPDSVGAGSAPNRGTRRASLPVLQVETPRSRLSAQLDMEDGSPSNRRRASSSSSMMDVLDEADEDDDMGH